MINALFIPNEKSLCKYCGKDMCTIKLLFCGDDEPTMKKVLELCHSCAVNAANTLKEASTIAKNFYQI